MPRKGPIKQDVLCVINTTVKKNGDKEVLRVVKWQRGSPMLEKRTFWDDNGEHKLGKAGGLTLSDLEMIEENWDDVCLALKGKKVEIESPDDDDAYGDEDDDYQDGDDDDG